MMGRQQVWLGLALLCCSLGGHLAFASDGSNSPAPATDQILDSTPSPDTPQTASDSGVQQWRTLTNIWLSQRPHEASITDITSAFPDKSWWEAFNDPALNAVMTYSLQHNWELAQAQSRADQARQAYRASVGRELPRVTFDPSFARQRNSANVVAPSNRQFQSNGPRLFAPGRTFNIFNAPLNISYELDLFQRNRLRSKSLKAQWTASTFMAADANRQLAAATAQAYWHWQGAKAMSLSQTGLVAAVAAQREQGVARVAQGLDSATPLKQLEITEAQERQRLNELNAQTEQAFAELARLCGESPEGLTQWWALQSSEVQASAPFGAVATDIEADATLVPELPKTPVEHLTAGLPAELATRRPDLRAAEWQLEAAKLDVKTARRALLPTIQLGGSVGLAATTLGDWLDWQSRLASVTAGLTQELFTGGQRMAEYRQLKARGNEALFGYQQTVVSAYRDVEVALSQWTGLAAAQPQLQEEANAVASLWALDQQRLAVGMVPLQQALQSEQQWRRLQQKAITHGVNWHLATADVYRALGGGF